MLGPCFIPESVFYTQFVMLSPRFIPSPCFRPSPYSVVRSPCPAVHILYWPLRWLVMPRRLRKIQSIISNGDFFLTQRFFIVNSYYKSHMAIFHSRLVIMISHDSFPFSYSNFYFSYSDFQISCSDFPISHSDFSISHIDHWVSIGDFQLNPLLSCLACHIENYPKKL